MVVYTNTTPMPGCDAKPKLLSPMASAFGASRPEMAAANDNSLWRASRSKSCGFPNIAGRAHGAYIASYVRFLVAASIACLRLMRRGELDVVHVHNIPDFLVFAGPAAAARGPQGHPRHARLRPRDIRDEVPTRGLGAEGALCLEERLSALVAHSVICVNHPQRDTLVARGVPNTKTFMSMNVPDPRIFRTYPGCREVSGNNALHLVYHGTMAHRLGVDLLIRAVALV